MIKRIKIFYKFLLIMLLLSAVPMAFVGWRLITINKLGLQDIILELHTNEAISISENVETYMRNLKEKIKFAISSQSGSDSGDWWDLSKKMLTSMIASSQEFHTISIVTITGNEVTKVYHPSLEGKVRLVDRSKDETFIKCMETQDLEISGLYYEEGIPKINLAYPFRPNLYLYIEASLDRLHEKVRGTIIGKTGYAYIVDRNGRIIMHRDTDKAINAEDASDRPIVQAVVSRRLVGSNEYKTKEGKVVVGAYAPVAALDWGVIVQQDKEEAYLSATRMRNNAAALVVAIVILACLLGYLLAQNLTGPILRLTKTANRIAYGDFEVNEISKWYRQNRIKDELTDLAGNFINMAQELQRYTDMQADKMKAVLFSIMDGIIMTDYSGNIVLSNRRAKNLLQIQTEEKLEGRNIKDIIKRKEISDSLEQVSNTKENVIKEIDLSTSEEERMILRADTSLVSHSESGQELGTVLVIRDITLEKEIEQLKEDFVHSITHDLRSPMTSIRGFLEFLIDGTAGEINEQQKEFLEIIDKSSSRLLDMINNILDVAKLDSGTMPIEKEPMSIFETAEAVVESLKSQADKEHIKLHIVRETELKQLMGDKNLLHRVITNLTGNSLKFTPENGEIKIILTDKGDKLRVSVNDTGEGMPAEYLDKIFNKFEQVKSSRARSKGTGLGLTISKHVVEAHGGTIWVESELGVGSTFIFEIPWEHDVDNK